MASAGEPIASRAPSRVTVPRVGRRDAEQALHRLGAAGADQPVETENLAPPQLEGNVGIFGRVRQPLDRQDDVADRHVALGEDLVDRTADHHAHELRLGDGGDRPVADLLAVAQADEVVGDAEDLVELVAR